MDFLTVTNQLMPGFDLLSEVQQLAFQNTPAGRIISCFVGSLKQHWLSPFTRESHQKTAQQKLQTARPQLLDSLQETASFDACRIQIICVQAVKKYPYLKNIIDNEARMSHQLEEVDLDDNEAVLVQVSALHDILFPSVVEIDQLFTHRVRQLALFFPLLAAVPLDEPSLHDWVAKYRTEQNQILPNISEIEEKILAEKVFFVLHENRVEYGAVLHNFNLTQSELIAKKIIRAFNADLPLDTRAWIDAYQIALLAYLEEKMVKVNNKKWTSLGTKFDGAVFATVSAVLDQLAERSALMADAHAIIQATGFATQNENSHLAFLDFINYWRYASSIVELKNIFAGLLQPLLPLYLEYRSIGLNEKNRFYKALRTVMPALIVAAFVVSVFSLLTTFLLPELASLVVLIPALYVGALLAAQYVLIRDNIATFAEELYFGGHYNIPFYHINPRMLTSFGSEFVAEVVRDYYVEEMKKCDETELSLDTHDKTRTLSSLEIDARKKNIIRKNTLHLEWVDIHNNKAFGYDKVKLLVNNRFHEDGDNLLKALKKDWQEEDLPVLRGNLAEALAKVVNCFENRLAPPVDQNIQDALEEQPEVAPGIQNTPFPRFFRPICYTHKEKLERIAVNITQLGSMTV